MPHSYETIYLINRIKETLVKCFVSKNKIKQFIFEPISLQTMKTFYCFTFNPSRIIILSYYLAKMFIKIYTTQNRPILKSNPEKSSYRYFYAWIKHNFIKKIKMIADPLLC